MMEVPNEIVSNFKSRILKRFYTRLHKQFIDLLPIEPVTFEELFNLPEGVTLEMWLFLALRGRSWDFYKEGLSVDHLVALDRALSLEELKTLMSWKNTRLIPPSINSRKSSFWDDENKSVCTSLLGREPNGVDTPVDLYQEQRNAERQNRYEKLLSRGKGRRDIKIPVKKGGKNNGRRS